MAQQTATDDDAQLANELDDLATVFKAAAHDDGTITVTFERSTVSEPFNAKMLSDGYAVANAIENVSGRMKVHYKSITDF
jgi:hypothetical protein